MNPSPINRSHDSLHEGVEGVFSWRSVVHYFLDFDRAVEVGNQLSDNIELFVLEVFAFGEVLKRFNGLDHKVAVILLNKLSNVLNQWQPHRPIL